MAPSSLTIVPTRPEHDARVESIRDRMLEGQWRGASEVVTLAREWKVSLSHVRELVRAAEGQIRSIARGDLEAARARFTATVDRYRLMAEELAEEGGKGAPAALRAALVACDMIAKMGGLYPARETIVTNRAAWAGLSPEEKRDRLTAAEERIAELKAELASAEHLSEAKSA